MPVFLLQRKLRYRLHATKSFILVKLSLNVCFSQEEEVDPYADFPKVNNEQTIFLSTHTQIKRVEVLISSNEEAYRRKHYPTIEERIEKQRDWARIQVREAKMESERAALKKAMEMKTIAARKHMEAVEEARREGLPIPEEPADEEVDPMVPEEPAGPGGAPLPDGEDEDETMNPADLAMNDDFAAELLEIKERKLLASRKTLQYHKEMSRWEKRKLALRMHYGWMGKRDRDITVVLPWLLLGRREVSTNQSTLLQMGVTHILNMTHDCPCVYPNTFIYQRVPVRDNITTDLAAHFTTIINFIKRVEKCKGRVSKAFP